MKVLIFGNLASGKSYLANKILESTPNLEYLSVDEFRRKIGDGTMEKERLAKQTFLDSILPDKSQLIEATGLGDTGEAIAAILRETKELKLIIILKTPLETCLKRLKTRVWNTPYPAHPEQAFKLAEVTDELINDNLIQKFWSNVKNCEIVELENIMNKDIQQIIASITATKHMKIINKLPTIFAKCKGIKVALLIGSFARKQTTSNSDIDYTLLIDKSCFNPNQLCGLIESNLSHILKIMRVNLRNKIVVYFKDCPKLELNWYENLPEININFLGSEIDNVYDSIVFQQTNLELDIEKYLKQIIAEKKQNLQNNGIDSLVRDLSDKFIYEFESASHLHKRSDSYKFYFFYNIALDIAVKLNYLSIGKTEHYYLPKNFSYIYKEKEDLKFFRELNATLYLPEANKKKRNLLKFFYTAIEKLKIHTDTEIQAIKQFLEFIYTRDFIWNFRDAATFNTKMSANKIFRSSSLTRYQNESFFVDFIKQYKINKIVDLRTTDEYAKNSYSENSLRLFEHLNLSIDPRNQSDEFIKNYHYGTDTQIAYRHFALGHRHVFKAIFEQIDPAKDVFLVHCHVGRDRTGSVIALFGLLIEESLTNIQQDYLESEMDADVESLIAFLEIIQKNGVENFLLECGINQERINYWKKHLKNGN